MTGKIPTILPLGSPEIGGIRPNESEHVAIRRIGYVNDGSTQDLDPDKDYYNSRLQSWMNSLDNQASIVTVAGVEDLDEDSMNSYFADTDISGVRSTWMPRSTTHFARIPMWSNNQFFGCPYIPPQNPISPFLMNANNDVEVIEHGGKRFYDSGFTQEPSFIARVPMFIKVK